MDQDLYDEFGNYIGPGFEDDGGLDSDLSLPASDVDRLSDTGERDRLMAGGTGPLGDTAGAGEPVTRITRQNIVEYDPESVYKDDDPYENVEVFVREEDTQTIEVPIVKAEESHVERVYNIRRLDSDINSKNFDIMEESMPPNRFTFQFMASLMNQPEFIRNVCIAGNLHDGKTTLVDRLIEHSRFTHRGAPGASGKGLGRDGAGGSGASGGHTQRPTEAMRTTTDFTRYTDSRLDEQAREMSIKATPISLVFQNNLYENVADFSDHPKCKSYLFNIFDTPGHVNFMDEFVHALALSDGCVLVVDVLMGLTSVLENVIKQCVHDGVKMCLVVNCLDRLVLELRLPPADAYLKICHTIGEVNQYLSSTVELFRGSAGNGLFESEYEFAPEKNNVAFASGIFGIFFTLKSFAKLYSRNNLHDFSRRLYGDYFYNPVKNTITTKSVYVHKTSEARDGHGYMNGTNHDHLNGTEDYNEQVNGVNGGTDGYDEHGHGGSGDQSEEGKYEEMELKRTFVAFILEPIYKLISHVASDEREQLEEVLEEFNCALSPEVNIALKKDDYKLTTKQILAKVCSYLFTDASAFVEMVISSVPSPQENNYNKFRVHYTGDLSTSLVEDVKRCDPRGKLVVFVTKNYFRSAEGTFDLFGRVFSGTLKKGHEIKLLGPSYTLDDDEDVIVRNVSNVWISEARYRVEVTKIGAGNWVLISGIDLCHFKTSTITHGLGLDTSAEDLELMTISSYLPVTKPVFKVGLEPLNPNELPKMINGLRAVEKAYPASVLKVEESGEHVVLGTGEVYLDCVLHDLRRLFGNLEIKVSDPVVRFTETIMESSSMRCFVNTANQKNKLYMLTQPLQQGVASLVEERLFSHSGKGMYGYATGGINGIGPSSSENLRLLKKYGWDELDIANIWSFGPDSKGPNVLINDTIPSEVDLNLLNQVRSSVIQGFNWAAKEGPLIEEPIRNVKFRLIGCELSNEYMNITPGQIIPATRRLCYSSFLLSTPRLMEPVVFAEIQCPADCVSSVYTILSRRRGHVLRDMPKPGTPFYLVHAYLPAIESFGFETDLRIHSSGQAFCLTMFDHWNIVPGDPLDKSIVLKPLEPAPIPHLAREFLLKTRKRKGLTEDVSINTFFDDPMLSTLAENLQEFY
ncbi:hypothetical protein MACJ_002719 [Theileria orientalis]|uniref:Tr-type G domain-containing protein n=1 Tax=Theileria orientalis TaxID=68886 RepID=A0A976QRK1_THEOR|nr:hypothetical protein MACJ_002719 [Theileria orientalis]